MRHLPGHLAGKHLFIATTVRHFLFLKPEVLSAASLPNLSEIKYPEAEVIAGVATGAIAHAVLVAEVLNLPFIYVRSTPKGHGLENLIEGDIRPGSKVVIIEDLVSTGSSSLSAAEAVHNFGGIVLGMLAIFTYNFPLASRKFEAAGIELTTLSNYDVLLKVAYESGEITDAQLKSLQNWRKSPETWGK